MLRSEFVEQVPSGLFRYNPTRQIQNGGIMAKAAAKAKANSGFMKPMQPSEHLAKIVGTEPLPRSEVTKKIWAHIKKNRLQNPKNKREILADEKLQPIFGGKKLDMFQAQNDSHDSARVFSREAILCS